MDDYSPNPDIDSSAPAPALPDDSGLSQPATLTPDQAVAFGLQDCKPGDTYTIKVRFTGDGDNGSKNVDVVSTEPDTDEGDDDSGAPAPDAEPLSPMGDEGEADDGAPAEEGDDQSKAEEKMLGFKRKKKKNSAMPFSIDRLRS